MTKWLSIFLRTFVSLFRTRRDLAFENLLLRQQLAVLRESGTRPQLSSADRSFWVLFVLVVLSHDRREIVHTNVTESPTAEWTARQGIEAVGLDKLPKYLVRDRDRKFSAFFSRQVASVGLREVLTAPASPWQNVYAERVIGTIRRVCLDHTIILNERHLRRTVQRYVKYYNGVRTHLSLDKDAPRRRPVQLPCRGAVRSRRHCGGLHHEYYRQAA